MNIAPTSRTLFLVQIGTFFSGVIVIVCCCLYLSAYPNSPDPGSVSAIACGTLAFAFISTIITLTLVIRQKSGRTVNANIEGCWVGLAIVVWVLAAVGGIAKPANGMTNVSCKVLPTGKDTDDKNFIRACQSMFASTAFCIASALLFMATAVILIIFSIQRAVRDKKAAQVKIGGEYQLGPSPSQYRRAEANYENPVEEPKDEEATSPSTDPASTAPGTSVLEPATATSAGTGGHFSNNVYQDPVIATPALVATPPAAVVLPTSGTPSPYNTYPSGGHVAQASYQSNPGPYDYNTTSGANGGYFGQETGHIQQGSAVSNLSASTYDQYHPNPYGNSGNMYPPQQPAYPQQTYPQQTYPMMGAPIPNSPYGSQYINPQQPGTPVMEMPRPEHF
ncbi:hypothetical protein BGZ58_002418 [Dissophora ornata]|nr:hypothetical protein BGZ58_002418 [Dissophora ornata]